MTLCVLKQATSKTGTARVRASGDSSISRYGEYTNKRSTPDIYETNTGGHALTLHFESFQLTDSGEYECRLWLTGLNTSVLERLDG